MEISMVECLRGIRNGDKAYYEIFVKEHLVYVNSTAFRLTNNRERAAAIAVEVFEKLWNDRRHIKPRNMLVKTWIALAIYDTYKRRRAIA